MTPRVRRIAYGRATAHEDQWPARSGPGRTATATRVEYVGWACVLLGLGALFYAVERGGTSFLPSSGWSLHRAQLSPAVLTGSLPTLLHTSAIVLLMAAVLWPSRHVCIAAPAYGLALGSLLECVQHPFLTATLAGTGIGQWPLGASILDYAVSGTFDTADLAALAVGTLAAGFLIRRRSSEAKLSIPALDRRYHRDRSGSAQRRCDQPGGRWVRESDRARLSAEAVEISTFELPDGVVGSAYSTMLVATNGDGSYAWALTEGQLPAGLTLSAQGEISGTPTQSEEQTFTVSVTSDGATDSRELLLRIAAP